MKTDGAFLLRRARKEAGLSRRALGLKAGVPTSTVSRIEEGTIDPTLEMLDRLVEAAGKRLAVELIAGESEPTLASLATAVEQSSGRLRIDWTRLRGFADWARQNNDKVAAAIADPPVRTNTPLDYVLAAMAELLADEHGVDRPRWTRAVGRLQDPWSPPATPAMQSRAAQTTPEPFRRRNLILPRSAIFRTAA